MQQTMLEREIWIAASPERVWRAVSEPEQIARWLLPPALGAQLRGDAEGRLRVGMGPIELPLAQLEALDPLRQLTLRGLPDQQAAATLTLSEADGGTRVVVRLSGFERFAEAAHADRLAPGLAGWEKTLLNLQAVVVEGELPFPEGYIASLFGYRRETAERFAVERSIWIAAPRERVWQAVTDPAQMEQWFSPGTAWQLTALEVGGRLFAPDPATGEERYTQLLTAVDPPQRLVIHTLPAPSGAVEVTTYTLTEERDGTRLTVTNAGYDLLGAEARWNTMEQNAVGFGMMLENVRAFVEGQPLPYPGASEMRAEATAEAAPQAVFAALADPTRRSLVSHLAGHSPKSATQLAAVYPITRQGILKHLSVLEEAGLVRVQQAGREKRYSLTPEPLADVKAWVAEIGALWDSRLLRLKALVEGPQADE